MKPGWNIRKTQVIDDKIQLINQIESFLEILLLGGAFYLTWIYSYQTQGNSSYYGSGKPLLVGVYMALVLVIFYLCDSFKFGHLKLSEVAVSQSISIIIVNCFTYCQLCLILNKILNPAGMLVLTGIDLIFCFLLTYLYTVIYHSTYVPKNMIMVYGNENAAELKTKLDTRTDKYHIAQTIDCSVGFEKISEEINNHDAVIINDIPNNLRNDLLKYCYKNSIRVYQVPKISDLILRGADDITLFDTPLLLTKSTALSLSQRFFKRAFDIVLCIIAMVPAIPIMLVIAIAIKLEDGGPVFYKQKRVTLHGKEFNILKFRTMVTDSEKSGYDLSMRARTEDKRITKVGKVIRPCRMDEVPQMFNIIIGDMSIVGPRPERVENYNAYIKTIPEFVYRTKVKGGLTGFAQIYGKYNTSAYDKLRLDLMYIEKYSFLLDVKLIFMTLQVLFKRESTEGFK